MADRQLTSQISAHAATEFIECMIENVLYERGVLQPNSFTKKKQYDLNVYTITSGQIKQYVASIMSAVEAALASNALRKVILLIANVCTLVPLERWEFTIDTVSASKDKPMKTIHAEMQGPARQVRTYAVTLPIRDVPCSFDVQLETLEDHTGGSGWSEVRGGRGVEVPGEELPLKGISTGIHGVDVRVVYFDE
ncbi:Mitotic spindle checkpoint protein MAD2 [Carpediemonas membranifera]|uniref:Mitotic spindle checkpoint protein MAD2 n=1 Tax=Carpediemonas membranifera TaxID=201153 RepID=A0A8J6DZ86_9EUKA|nr:Mitotic spindle checkpoint protein MAD2 [Carpediemonas membranifera]|eukprot:KAG9390086.1 Mitotic spindle checkpoint protein MAD2 [Carpediemonas membranifera]